MTRKAKTEGSWLSMLKMELDYFEAEDLIEPITTEDDEDEEVIGEASQETRRLWTYFCTLEEQATRMLVDAKYCRDNRDHRDELLKRAFELRAKAEMARNILFLNIRDQFGVWDPTLGIGIRSGWRVVAFKSSDNPLFDLLKGQL